MIIFDFFFDSIEQVQFILFGYSFGNIGLIKFKPVDDVRLYFEHTSTIVESNQKYFIQLFYFSITYFEYIDKK
jgi:hypothetical protein